MRTQRNWGTGALARAAPAVAAGTLVLGVLAGGGGPAAAAAGLHIDTVAGHGKVGLSGNGGLALDWTRQTPAAHPAARDSASMAYDAATSNTVLFGGSCLAGGHAFYSHATWTWDGSAWTKQAPAAHPSARYGASMAYDAATGTIVLFGGVHGDVQALGDTWTWDGTTWTKQAPAASPPARYDASMAYDAATRTIVLFGGDGSHARLRGTTTWTWDGSTWTKHTPAAHPPAGDVASMAYDPAADTIVRYNGDTWTWDGSTWTKQTPAASPSPGRYGVALAYDAATGNLVLFGGYLAPVAYRDTWTWDGSTWTKQAPATSPPARGFASMAYDAARRDIVLFGGFGTGTMLNDTWTWGLS
jgi:hypothetical protein